MNFFSKNFCLLLLVVNAEKTFGQTINVDGSIEYMNDVNFALNNPIVCNDYVGHGDNLGFAHDKEKVKNNNFGDTWARTLRFKAMFEDNASYDLGNYNQKDWNKLMTINKKSDGDEFSIRLGWRWNLVTSKMDIGFYGHINHTGNDIDNVGREFLKITEVDLETFYNYELIFGASGYGVIANGIGSYIKREDVLPEDRVKTAYRKRAYFGGQECPPHKIKIKVEDINGDEYTNWHDAACSKTFSRSIFYDYDNLTIKAADRIIMSEQVYKGQWNNEDYNNGVIPQGFSEGDEIEWSVNDHDRFVNVNTNSTVHCLAGNEIILLEGFHSYAGSEFHAEIDSSIICESFKSLKGNFGAITDSFLKIHPNPFRDNFVLTVNESEVIESYKIYDIYGFLLLSERVTAGTNSIELNHADLNRGIYIIEVLTNRTSYNEKIIKE